MKIKLKRKPPKDFVTTEQELQQIIKTIVQTGKLSSKRIPLTPEQKARIKGAFEIYKARDKSKPLRVDVLLKNVSRKIRRQALRDREKWTPKFGQ
jgi:hypothetical protein